MKRPTLLVALALLALAPLTAGAVNLGKDYDVLNNKNIFSKNRTVYHRDPNRPVRDVRVRTQRTYTPILIGAMLEDDGYVAFIVDPKSRDITSVRPGDVLPMSAGTLKEATLDYIITDPGNGKPADPRHHGPEHSRRRCPEYPDSSDDATADSPDASGPSTQPGSAASGTTGGKPADSSTPAASDGSVDSIAERLRKRSASSSLANNPIHPVVFNEAP